MTAMLLRSISDAHKLWGLNRSPSSENRAISVAPDPQLLLVYCTHKLQERVQSDIQRWIEEGAYEGSSECTSPERSSQTVGSHLPDKIETLVQLLFQFLMVRIPQ